MAMDELPIPIDTKAGGVNRDYLTIWEDLVRHIPQILPEWTYRGQDDFGIALTQLLAYAADHLHYDGDRVLRELSVASSIFRHIMQERSEWLGYKIQRPEPATATVVLTLVGPALTQNIKIPARTKISTAGLSITAIFETDAEVTLAAGTTSVTVEVTEGQSVGPVSLGIASGDASERFVLVESTAIFNFRDTDFAITVDGEAANLVQFSVDAGPEDLSYTARITRNDNVEIRFGDGNFGKLLNSNADVFIQYRKGGGRVGRVPAGSITQLQGIITKADGTPVSFTANNVLRSFGGLEPESLDSIRRNAPAFFRSQNRAVTLGDYELHARTVPGVFAAKGVHVGVNGVILYVVPDGAEDGDVLSDALRNRITNLLDGIRMAADVVTVTEADLIPIDMDIDVTAFANFRNSVVRDLVLFSLTGVLSFQAAKLGKFLALSDTIRVLELLEGVDYLNINRHMRRPTLRVINASGNAAFSAAGVTVTNDAQEQIWRLEFLNTTTFAVVGSISGPLLNNGILDVGYNANNEINFRLAAGTTAMSEGDVLEISVGRLVHNINLTSREFPVVGKIKVNITGGIE